MAKAVEEREKLEQQTRKEVDIVWVVFDKDDADLNESRITNWNKTIENANG